MQKLYIFLLFSKIQFLAQKTTASQTNFGFTNIGSNSTVSVLQPFLSDFLQNVQTLDFIIAFRWMTSFLWKGYKTEIEKEDLYQVIPEDESKFLGDELEK